MAQQHKDPAVPLQRSGSLLQHEFNNPVPRDFHMTWCSQKKKKNKKPPGDSDTRSMLSLRSTDLEN